ncbi:MAG: hypothetical protein KAI24_08415, partial [Planctomycetes bacterium]|nr:hypothetical protein [Planctomycetota bacterium]
MTVVLLILAALLALFALLPLLRLWSAGRAARVAAVSVALVAVASMSIATSRAPEPADRPEHRPLEVLAEGHVGSATCRSCHPGEHASWHGSFHRTMTQVASRANVLPRFERLELDWFGEPVLLEWRGDRLWTVFERGGGRPARVERPIEQLTGSHHMQVFW